MRDDDGHYDYDDPAIALEQVETYLCRWLEQIEKTIPHFESFWCDDKGVWHYPGINLAYSELCRQRASMRSVIQDLANRKGRLADIAVGLSDVQLDEERAEGDPGSDG